MAKMKLKARLKDGVTTVKVLMSHPMETGLRKDKKTGEMIPAHHITEVMCEHNGATVLSAEWGGAISKNPYLSFKFNGGAAGDSVKITWTDNKGESETAEGKIG
ncbi:thiosulfate oxidation carrier complex protein SoxZ [Endothiovibrio diazotrophicus]